MISRQVFDSEHELFRDMVRKFLQSEAMPFHEEWEEQGQVSREVWLKAGQQGMLCPTISEKYGGVGADYRYNAVVTEEVSRFGLTGIGWSLHSDIAVPYLENYGTEQQKQAYLPRCISGEIITPNIRS